MFGETSAYLGCHSDVSYAARTYCKIARLHIFDYLKIEAVRPQMKKIMTQLVKIQL